LSRHWPKSGGVKKNFLLAPLAEFAPPHFQNRGAAPESSKAALSRPARMFVTSLRHSKDDVDDVAHLIE